MSLTGISIRLRFGWLRRREGSEEGCRCSHFEDGELHELSARGYQDGDNGVSVIRWSVRMRRSSELGCGRESRRCLRGERPGFCTE